ncbi:ALF repeat-containing protein [Actinoplanes xinjiangensis]|uniref:ALF repeat-containing protein n=1 Tax=Actinoplanes xinjiangensis TaxID=512350 RepID=UPI00341B8AFC
MEQAARTADTERLDLFKQERIAEATAARQKENEALTAALADATETTRLDTETRRWLAEASAAGAGAETVLSSGRKAAVRLVERGGNWTRAAAVTALTGGVDEVRAFVTGGLRTAALEDDRDRVLDITATTTKDAQRVAGQAVLTRPHTEIEEWLRTRTYPGKATDDRLTIAGLVSSGGTATKAAATAALNGTDAARQAFLTTGRYEAEDKDNRVRIAQIMSAGGPEVKAAGEIALSGPRIEVLDFLKRGQYLAARRDAETATHVSRVAAMVQEAATTAANARTDAAKAQKLAAEARKAAADAAKYAQQAADSANQAAAYAAQAQQSAKAAAVSAAKAAQAAQTARNAAATARSAAASATRSATQAQRAADSAKAAAGSAYASMRRAYESARAAGRSAAEAQTDADAAMAYAIDLHRREDAEEPPNLLDPPPNGLPPIRLSNTKNNMLASTALALWGGECFAGTKQMICVNVGTPDGKTMTIGDFMLYPRDRNALVSELQGEADIRAGLRSDGIRSDIYGPDLLEHESNHSDQWALRPDTASFLIGYYSQVAYSQWKTGTYGDANFFEIEANPYKGGYWTVAQGQRPPPFNVREPVDVLAVQQRILDEMWRQLTKPKCYMSLWC